MRGRGGGEGTVAAVVVGDGTPGSLVYRRLACSGRTLREAPQAVGAKRRDAPAVGAVLQLVDGDAAGADVDLLADVAEEHGQCGDHRHGEKTTDHAVALGTGGDAE